MRDLQSASVHEGSKPYKYAPLDENKQEIRLLTLLPGQFSSEIRICLEVAQFTKDEVPRFEAVSYTWGSAENPVDIFIGQSGNKTLSVTQNLAEALPYFRFEDKPRVLWIDAICVNQQNLEERGMQNSSHALLCLQRIASKVKFNWHTMELSAIPEELHWADLKIALPLVEKDWIALHHLIHRPWFERLWIRQEVYLASRDPALMCGHQIISWTSVCNSVACLWIKPISSTSNNYIEPFRKRLRFVFDLCDARKEFDLSILIGKTKLCVCLDPRDRIYSLLSLLPIRSFPKIEPDYTKSVREVYRDVALSIIQTTKFHNLHVLTTIESNEQEQRVPSWVPDVSVEELKKIAIFALSQEHLLQKHQLKAFCRTIKTNLFREQYSPPAKHLPGVSQSEEVVRILLELLPEAEHDVMIEPSLKNLLALAMARCNGRSFFLTREGNFGLGPHNTRLGDFVTVLLGCQKPLVLRKRSESEYEVVGEAYCDGSTDGEALLGPIPQPFVPRLRYDGTQLWYWNYLNQETGLFQAEDPRLGPLPPGWSLRSHPNEDFQQWIVNDETGEEACPDPRLTSEALRERGVPLQEFVLI
ncbi:hypothetical protein N431DRAFT_545839 [Stipitochalara longipes BDJ]|nr:hypothetical protein N431DRAFT_545839 [Stipitochalara longipes BDJ]